MRTIRWCETHDRQPQICYADRVLVRMKECVESKRTAVDPTNPDDIAEFLRSLGFEQQAEHRDPLGIGYVRPYEGLNTRHERRWVGPWEPVNPTEG